MTWLRTFFAKFGTGAQKKLSKPVTKKAVVARDGVFSWAEVAKHNTPDDAWMVIEGEVYDVSGFGERHPGGEVVYSYAGECSQAAMCGPMSRSELVLFVCLRQEPSLHRQSFAASVRGGGMIIRALLWAPKRLRLRLKRTAYARMPTVPAMHGAQRQNDTTQSSRVLRSFAVPGFPTRCPVAI